MESGYQTCLVGRCNSLVPCPDWSETRKTARVDSQDFISKYPSLWHLAHADSWPSIERHGLFSCQQIVRRWEVPAEAAQALLARRRPEPVVLEHPDLGRAVLRDQHPLSEERLAPALTDGMTVAQWLRLLNSMVFFFPSEKAMRGLHAAYCSQPAVVLKVRTRSLLDAHGARVRLAGINTGYTMRKVTPRGRDTFLPVRRYDHTKRAVQEVAVLGEVDDLNDHLLAVEHLPALPANFAQDQP